MGVSITYKLGGRTVSQSQFFSGLEGEIRKMAVDDLTAKAGRVRCSEHGETASVSEVVATPNGFSFTLSGCCDELVRRAEAAL